MRVRTQPGKGSEFEIRLPATFGVLRSLVIVADGYRYCVDASQIVARLGIGADHLERSEKEESLSWQGEVLSVANMRKLLAQSDEEAKHSGKLDILICQLPDSDARPFKHIAVVVDAIEENQEVLVRSLGCHAARWIGIVGAAELRDGNVALVLDLQALLRERI